MNILAERLSKIIIDGKALSEHLGCSIQAVNQFKKGIAAPKHENLVEIAKFYGVSADYLLGLTDSKKPYLSVSEYTGLTEKAVDAIRLLDKKALDGLNAFLESVSNNQIPFGADRR